MLRPLTQPKPISWLLSLAAAALLLPGLLLDPRRTPLSLFVSTEKTTLVPTLADTSNAVFRELGAATKSIDASENLDFSSFNQ